MQQSLINDEFVSPYEAEYMIEAIRLIDIEQYGSTDWLIQHEQLDRLNIQAHKNAIGSTDEYIMDNFVTLDKINTLVADLLTTEAWKEFVFPELLKSKDKLQQIKMYMGMYHESSVCNLLEVMLYHRTACENSEDGLVELIDYCYRKFVKMTGDARKYDKLQQETPDKQDAKKVLQETPSEALQRQADELEFNCTMTALSLIRFITDHINDLSVPIVHQLMENNDMPCVLVPLLEIKPWLRKNVKGEMEKFEDQKWVVIPPHETGKLTKTEAQIWLAIYNMFMSREANRKYEVTSFRKSNLLRLRKFINEQLVDQLPMLSQMHRALEEMSMMGENNIAEKNSFIVQQMPEMRTKMIKGKDWKKISEYQLQKFFIEVEGKPDNTLKSLMKLYGSDVFDQFDDNPKCAHCGEPANHRCSKCKQEWYCSRECQLTRWKDHKKLCKIMSEIKEEDAKVDADKKEKMKAQYAGKTGAKKPLIEEVDTSAKPAAEPEKPEKKKKLTRNEQKKAAKEKKKEEARKSSLLIEEVTTGASGEKSAVKPSPKIDEIIPREKVEPKRKVLIEEITETKPDPEPAIIETKEKENVDTNIVTKKKGIQIVEVQNEDAPDQEEEVPYTDMDELD